MEPFSPSPPPTMEGYMLNENTPSMEGAKLCKKEREYEISIGFFPSIMVRHMEPFSPSLLPTMEGYILNKNTPSIEGAK